MSTQSGSLSDIAPRFAYPLAVAVATTYIRKMRGRSQALLVEDTYGKLFVLKMGNASSGFRDLANELIGTGLCEALGLSSPRCCLMQVNDQFLDRYPDAWFQTPKDRIRPLPGLYYGTAFIGTAEGRGRPFDVLPRTTKYTLSNREELCGMYLFDIWANHLDCRQSVYLRDPQEKSFRAIFIDNGLLFGGLQGRFDDCEPQTMFRRKDAANMEWRDGVTEAWLEQFRTIIPKVLAQVLGAVPSHWCGGELDGLSNTLLRRLEVIEELIKPFTVPSPNASDGLL